MTSPVPTSVRIVDANLPRTGGADRPLTQVAVGVLFRKDGRFLLTTRPAGKAYASHWEFPGGKIEPGETVAQALVRELEEELGITATELLPWRTERIDYPHAWVELHFCKVFQWQGELQMKEGQQFSWEYLPVSVTPLLAGTVPVLAWLDQAQSSISNSAFPTAV
ncbi:MAG: NUDIX domain-containing protein [Betaproteobacteria bacterium]|nr:NUDIX domain-containing protein [Betaproteobacteria bacterium]